MKDLFKKYYNSLLSPGEFKKVADYLSNHKNDSEVSQWMQDQFSQKLTEELETPKKNPQLFIKIQSEVLKDKNKHAQQKLKLYKWSLRFAAVLIVGLLIGNVLYFSGYFASDEIIAKQTITAPYGAKTNITLPDGSKVWLNSGSSITYPTKFNKHRPVTLLGEAFFEVEKNKKPFTVTTQYGNVEVTGTAFNVEAYDNNTGFKTTLVEGSVNLSAKQQQNTATLKPGQMGVLTQNGFKVLAVDTRLYTSWKEGKLIFRQEPFPSFIKKLERWYNVKIECSDKELDELWYTGVIEMESISEVMEMISIAAPVSHSFNSKTRIFNLKMK